MHYDIFNGDADGIFSLHQYRLENPAADARLVTGVKRDVQLLDQVEDIENCTITIFDISLDSNRSALLQLLQHRNTVCYFDHHFAGEIPHSPNLTTYIDTSREICTSLLVNALLKGKYALWAICGAFGDSLHRPATKLAKSLSISASDITRLQELGELCNYNGYGLSLSDLHFHPKKLYQAVQPYVNPLDFIAASTELVTLRTGCREDIALAMQQPELKTKGKNRVFLLPDARWARRISGYFINLRAREKPAAAHAVVSQNSDGSMRISIRSPLADPRRADRLCHLFPTGGGRAAAAGINSLPVEKLDHFLETFQSFYS
jgi:hypothetical protein